MEGEGAGKGVVYAYEAYEAKKRGEKLRCPLLRRKKKNIIILFLMRLHGEKFLNGPVTTVCLLLQDLLQSCSRGGRRRVEDMLLPPR